MTDEDIIKRKLMFDGDGTGDERRLNIMLKMLTKYVYTEYANPQEERRVQNSILDQLSLCEHARRRSQMVHNRNDQQFKQAQDFETKVQQQISQIKTSIANSKAILHKAKSFKQEKMVYSLIAKDIDKHTSREESAKKAAELQKEIDRLAIQRNALEERMEYFQKQFHVLATSANQMQKEIAKTKENL